MLLSPSTALTRPLEVYAPLQTKKKKKAALGNNLFLVGKIQGRRATDAPGLALLLVVGAL